ncbi:unnamed protein product [Diatraea saccharalis]|uniref:Uncharacterized protein n=1 Tax=Diatraea saccharalis TaxID=40085 RepID=A0A9N9QWM9_9NEOP|nr:unnamed protein product [Diatraea saccharalis]
MSSPNKKKARLISSNDESELCNHLKRKNQNEDLDLSKRHKADKILEDDLHAKKRQNFITACEIVSYKAYFNQSSRFQLVYLPTCAKNIACKHVDKKDITLKQTSSYVEESFNIEIKTNMWREALEVCRLCTTSEQYLSTNILKEVVEIMLNAHSDDYKDYTIDYLINKCQQIFEHNFNYHPPCLIKTLRKCYTDFLTSPMDLKENTFTNRSEFECNKGIVKYCLNRLEYEISVDSKDGPLLDKYEHIPEEMKQSVKGLHWQKEKFEIFELLDRTERINRLFAVLDSIVELLQLDLAIWNTRYTNNLGSHIMRSHKPLMAHLLWSNNVLYTGTVNNNCRQILRLFIYLIQLEYPEEHIKVITAWLNIIIQTFYICENNSNSDYPNTGKYCTVFAKEFYKLISGMSQKLKIKILERIKPDYMQYLIGVLHLKTLLATQAEDPISILIDFIKTTQWKKFPESKTEIMPYKTTEHSLKNVKNLFNFLNKKYANVNTSASNNSTSEKNVYKKLEDNLNHKEVEVTLNDAVHILYITVGAYLDAYSVQNMQEALDSLNEQLLNGDSSNNDYSLPIFCSYSVSEQFVKRYRSIYQTLRELMILLQEKRDSGELPETFKIFTKIGL